MLEMEREEIGFTPHVVASDARSRKMESGSCSCAGAIFIKKIFTSYLKLNCGPV
jgi:hypothetical protein